MSGSFKDVIDNDLVELRFASWNFSKILPRCSAWYFFHHVILITVISVFGMSLPLRVLQINSLFTLPKAFSKPIKTEIWTPHKSHNAPQDVDLVSAGGSKAETRLLFDDQVFEVFSVAFQENLSFLAAESTQIFLHISHSRWELFFGILSTIPSFHSLGNDSDKPGFTEKLK